VRTICSLLLDFSELLVDAIHELVLVARGGDVHVIADVLKAVLLELAQKVASVAAVVLVDAIDELVLVARDRDVEVVADVLEGALLQEFEKLEDVGATSTRKRCGRDTRDMGETGIAHGCGGSDGSDGSGRSDRPNVRPDDIPATCEFDALCVVRHAQSGKPRALGSVEGLLVRREVREERVEDIHWGERS
jgi:hypothetical protein